MALFSHGLKLKTSIRTLLEKEISNYTCLPCKPGSKLKIPFLRQFLREKVHAYTISGDIGKSTNTISLSKATEYFSMDRLLWIRNLCTRGYLSSSFSIITTFRIQLISSITPVDCSDHQIFSSCYVGYIVEFGDYKTSPSLFGN